MDLNAFIRGEVKPTLGCTEPGAVALAAASAARHLPGPPERIRLRLSRNIHKNGMNVPVPGGGGVRGNLAAAALGALAGDPDKGLEVLGDVDEAAREQALRMVSEGAVSIEIAPDAPPVFVEAELTASGHTATAIIAHSHDHVVEITRDQETVFRTMDTAGSTGAPPPWVKDLVRLDFARMWELAAGVEGELAEFILAGSGMNIGVARKGVRKPYGLGIGYRIGQRTPRDDRLWTIKAFTAAAADVRMSGSPDPVMSSAGAGNLGITAIVPCAVAACMLGTPDEELARALALSHLVTGALKIRTGRLSPICGCAVAAGAGAAAALTRMQDGDAAQAENAAGLAMAALMGMICDGAKPACALKVSTAAGEAYMASLLALDGALMDQRQGLVGEDFAANALALAKLCQGGFAATDQTVLDIVDKGDRP